ncbi:DUF5655 domain-containing protein [Geminicoccaceae bacterium 1502E]|nr:DUF5655 domain-containing protein [Geminicoccaceae bacterium 1502E]
MGPRRRTGRRTRDIKTRNLKNYFAFRRIKNFSCVEGSDRAGLLLVYVKVNPEEVEIRPGFTRDVCHSGHFGTGDLEISLASNEDLERAKPLLVKSYEASWQVTGTGRCGDSLTLARDFCLPCRMVAGRRGRDVS